MKSSALCALALAPIAALTGASSAAASAPTAATGYDQSAAVLVRYQDLDLAKTQDAERLLWRIKNAALDACGAPDGSLREYRAAVAGGECFKAGVARAVAEVNAPALNRLYYGRVVITVALN